MIDPLYLKQIEVGPMANFLYLVGDKIKKEVLIVDPAWQMDTVFKTVEREGLKVRGAIVTHGHFDHCNGIEDLLTRVDVPIYVQKEEVQFIKSMDEVKSLFGTFPEENLKTVGPEEKIRIGEIEITLLHTPGHTPGSQCFLIQNTLISGDTLFIRGCGRCD
ncbi:MAG: MBL fold metallo-hydrolase, partial [Elusimicrobia bacterium]|nr:MBL fold metallo-hydrolase [Elusimicrobiota bacterium]